MPRYIDAEALREYVSNVSSHVLCEWDTLGVVAAIEKQPTADVAPVRHARWEPSERYEGYASCSDCHDCYIELEWIKQKKWAYCANCGAIMDGGEDDGV